MRWRTNFLGLALFTATAAPGSGGQQSPTTPEVTVPAFPNSTCPIMGKPVSAKLFVDTDLGRIYICCKGCNTKILKDVPTAYKAAYPRSRKVANANCPLTGKPIGEGAATVTLQGHEISVCCADCVKKAPAQAQLVLTKATNPKLVDVGNATCPITGEPALVNTLVVIGDQIVRLARPESVDRVRADPAAALAKARAGRGS